MVFERREILEEIMRIRKRYCKIVSFFHDGRMKKRFSFDPATPKKDVLFCFRRVFYIDDNPYKEFEDFDWRLKKQFEQRCRELDVYVEREEEFDILPVDAPDEIIQMAKVLDEQFMAAGFGHWFKNFNE
ncbi:MAG: hypothetical protein IJF84_05315 [Thermoguttaceae bacterium]|nr:hypothetical protein [Thermoguttaceae bacterium]